MGTGRLDAAVLREAEELLAVDPEEGLLALLFCEGLLCALDELPCVGRLVAPEEDEGLEEEGLDAAVLSDEFPCTGRLAWLPSG